MKSVLIAIILTATLAIGMTGCGGSSSKCAAAIGHVYDLGCTSIIPQGADKEGAITGCEDMNDLVNKDCPCKSQFDAAMSCLKGIVGQGECSNCDSQMTEMYACASDNSTNCTTQSSN